MPGTPEEYAANPDTEAAAAAIDEALAGGAADGNSIIDALMAKGLRIYPEGEMSGEAEELPGLGLEEEMGEEMPEEMGMEGLTDLEAPPMAAGGRDEDIMAAVGAATKKDAADKERRKAEMEAV